MRSKRRVLFVAFLDPEKVIGTAEVQLREDPGLAHMLKPL